jgi:hypothetical protein
MVPANTFSSTANIASAYLLAFTAITLPYQPSGGPTLPVILEPGG